MYNHNFKGTYCTCDLPYPDPNVEEQIEMIQCCICEDWFHEEHMGLQSGDKVSIYCCPFAFKRQSMHKDTKKCLVVSAFICGWLYLLVGDKNLLV